MSKTSKVLDRMIDDTSADLAALRAENAKLREALEGMLKWFGKYPVFVPVGEALEDGRVDSAIEQARAALA